MIRIVRRVGIAIGSLVIAYLAVSLVAGMLLGSSAGRSPLIAVVIIVLGGLVFADIIRRERPNRSTDTTPTA
jgi:hypothetical protein